MAAYLFSTRSLFGAMAWPLLVLGGLELVIGATMATRTASQVVELESGLQAARAQTVTSEIERMACVNGTFVIVKKVEIALIAASILFLIVRPAPATLGLIAALPRTDRSPAAGRR
jgi:hypothetical protein